MHDRHPITSMLPHRVKEYRMHFHLVRLEFGGVGVGVGGGEVDCRSERKTRGRRLWGPQRSSAAEAEDLTDLEHHCEPWTETHHVFITRLNTSAAGRPDPLSRALPYLDDHVSGRSPSRPSPHAWHRVTATRAAVPNGIDATRMRTYVRLRCFSDLSHVPAS